MRKFYHRNQYGVHIETIKNIACFYIFDIFKNVAIFANPHKIANYSKSTTNQSGMPEWTTWKRRLWSLTPSTEMIRYKNQLSCVCFSGLSHLLYGQWLCEDVDGGGEEAWQLVVAATDALIIHFRDGALIAVTVMIQPLGHVIHQGQERREEWVISNAHTHTHGSILTSNSNDARKLLMPQTHNKLGDKFLGRRSSTVERPSTRTTDLRTDLRLLQTISEIWPKRWSGIGV